MPTQEPSPSRLAALAVLAAALHLAFDAIGAALPWTSPPYLLLAWAPEPFRVLSPVAVSIAASAVDGAIAAIALAALEPSRGRSLGRQAILLAAVLWAFWLLSGGLLAAVWLAAPAGLVVASLAAGIPRCAAVAFALAALSRPRRRAEGGER